MKFYIFFLSFFILQTTHTALIEKNLLDLPAELLYNIFELMPFSHKDYKNWFVSNFFYHLLHNYMLERQNTLLSKNEINQKIKKQIVFNNRLLLGYLRNQKNKVYNELEILRKWDHGKLIYYLKDDYSTIYYCPSDIPTNLLKKDIEEIPLFARKVTGKRIVHIIKNTLYDVTITNQTYENFFNYKEMGLVDFLEWYPIQESKKTIKINNEIGNLNSNSTNPDELDYNDKKGIDLGLVLDFKVNCEIQAGKNAGWFLNPTQIYRPLEPVRLYNCLGAVKIISPLKSIQGELDAILPFNKSISSLSLLLSINPDTKSEDFWNIGNFCSLKKLTLCFLENSNSNKNIDITCPKGVEKLILKNCCVKICIPFSLKNLKIISPKEGCKINQDITVNGFIPFVTDQEKKLTSLHIENDKIGVVKNILQDLEIDQPQTTRIENCSYDQLRPELNAFEKLLLKITSQK